MQIRTPNYSEVPRPNGKSPDLTEIQADYYFNLLTHPNYPAVLGEDTQSFPIGIQHFIGEIKIVLERNPNNIFLATYKGKRICFYNNSKSVFDVQHGHIVEIGDLMAIDDLFEFFQSLKSDQTSLDSKLIYMDIAKKFLNDISAGKTGVDHIKNIVRHLLLDSFSSIDEKWGYLGHMRVRRDVTDMDMEGVYELNFAVTEDDEPNFSEQLPTVRYGFVGADGAIIYAVQTPKYRGLSKVSAENELTHTWRVLKYVNWLNKFKGLYPDDFLSIFGEGFDEALFKNDFDAFEKWIKQILINKENYERLINLAEGHSQHFGREFFHFKNAFKEYCFAREATHKFEEMATNQSEMKKIFDEKSPSVLRGAPPAMLTSLCATIYMLHETGVRNIEVPLTLILREHPGSADTQDERKFNQMRKLLHRLVFEVEGVSIVADVEKYPSSANTTVKINFDEKIKFKSQGVRKLLGIDAE